MYSLLVLWMAKIERFSTKKFSSSSSLIVLKCFHGSRCSTISILTKFLGWSTPLKLPTHNFSKMRINSSFGNFWNGFLKRLLSVYSDVSSTAANVRKNTARFSTIESLFGLWWWKCRFSIFKRKIWGLCRNQKWLIVVTVTTLHQESWD